MSNDLKGGVATIYAGLVYGSTLLVWLTNGTPFPDNPIGWIISITGIIIAPLLARYYFRKVTDEEEQVKTEKLAKMVTKIQSIPNFNYSQRYFSYDESTQFLIDEKKMKIAIVDLHLTPLVYEYRDILKSDLIQDGVTVSSTNRGSQIGGVLLGGILAGGVGAIIGGLSGSQTNEEKVKEITLQIIINDTKNPVHKIHFFKAKDPVSKELCKTYLDKAMYCHNLISVLLKQADEQDNLKEESEQTVESIIEKQNTPSISDELSKLFELKKEGVISEEEFNNAKKMLLSS